MLCRPTGSACLSESPLAGHGDSQFLSTARCIKANLCRTGFPSKTGVSEAPVRRGRKLMVITGSVISTADNGFTHQSTMTNRAGPAKIAQLVIRKSSQEIPGRVHSSSQSGGWWKTVSNGAFHFSQFMSGDHEEVLLPGDYGARNSFCQKFS